MRKMRKLLLSLLLFPLALISCGANRVYGHYAFQMGSDKGTHFGVYTNLLNEDVYGHEDPLEEESPIVYKGKKFTLGMNVSDDVMPLPPEEDPEPTVEKTIMWLFLTTMVDGLGGYFSVGDKTFENLGKRLYLTISPEEFFIPIDEELASMFIVAYIDNNAVKLIMPVSLDDMLYQLCWYGLFVYVYEDDSTIAGFGMYPKDLSKEPAWVDELHYSTDLRERVGTHPTEHDVEDMNRVFNYIFQGKTETGIPIDYTFRNHNSLTVELLKE